MYRRRNRSLPSCLTAQSSIDTGSADAGLTGAGSRAGSLFDSTSSLLLNIFRQAFPDILRGDFIFDSGVAIPVGTVQLPARTLAVFFPTADPLLPVRLITEGLPGGGSLSRRLPSRALLILGPSDQSVQPLVELS